MHSTLFRLIKARKKIRETIRLKEKRKLEGKREPEKSVPGCTRYEPILVLPHQYDMALAAVLPLPVLHVEPLQPLDVRGGGASHSGKKLVSLSWEFLRILENMCQAFV